MKLIKLPLFFIFSSISFLASAQTLFVNKKNGQIENYPVSSVSKLTFDNANMSVHLLNFTENIKLSDIQFLNFLDLGLAINDFSENHVIELKVYPNPVNSELRISVNSELDISVAHISFVSIDGKTVLTHSISNLSGGEFIFDVANLSTGVYLINFHSDIFNQSFKFIKL